MFLSVVKLKWFCLSSEQFQVHNLSKSIGQYVISALPYWYTCSARLHLAASSSDSWLAPQVGTNKCTATEGSLKTYCSIPYTGFTTLESRNNLIPYYGLDNEIIVPSNKYKPVQRRTRRSVSSNQTMPSELESIFRRPKRDTSDETGFKSALQRLGREVNLTSRLITWPPREVRPET